MPSNAIRTGTRWVTLTQLPLAFWAGSSENSLPVPAPMLCDMGGEFLAGIGVDLDRRALARDHPADVLFLEVGFDPCGLAVDQAEHADAGHGHLPDLQVVGILDHAIHRRADVGPRQVELGLVDRGLGLGDRRLLARSDRGMGIGGARAGVGQVLLGGLHFVERILIVGARGEALLQQRLLARQAHSLDREIGLLAGDVGARARRLRPQLARRSLAAASCAWACSSATW